MQGILNISEAASLAMHAMVLLADEPGKIISTKEAAEKFQASENHLSKVLQRLTRAGLVKSIRGPKGGYILGKQPEKVTLLEVYEAIEGKFISNNCLFEKEICDGRTCITGGLINSINSMVKRYFEGARLNDLTVAFSLCSNNGNSIDSISFKPKEPDQDAATVEQDD